MIYREAIVEIPVGGSIRGSFDGRRLVEVAPYGSSAEVPALEFVAYGFLVGILNQADGEECDVYILGAEGQPIGVSIEVRTIGAKFRRDGDHKFLTVAKGSRYDRLRSCEELGPALLGLIGRWGDPRERADEPWLDRERADDLLRGFY